MSAYGSVCACVHMGVCVCALGVCVHDYESLCMCAYGSVCVCVWLCADGPTHFVIPCFWVCHCACSVGMTTS